MRRAFFYGWIVVAVTAVVVVAVTAGWLALLAGFAAMAIRRPVDGLPVPPAPAEGAPAEASAT